MGFWKKNNDAQNGSCANKNNAIKKFPMWFLGVCVGAIFLGIGAYEEQFADFYRKAVMICLECIGIG